MPFWPMPAPRDAMPCLCVAPPCSADAQQCHAFASALRCDALPLLFAAMQYHAPALLFMTHAPQIKPAPFRCSPLLCVPIAWQCLAMPALRQSLPSRCQSSPLPCVAEHSPRIAGPSIAVTVLSPASPPRCLPPQSHRRAFPRSATAFRRSAPPSLVCAHPRPCAALRCPALPSLFWSILRLTAWRLAILRPRHAFPDISLPVPIQRFASPPPG